MRRNTAFMVFTCLLVLVWCMCKWMFANEYLEWTHKRLPQRELHSEHFVFGRDDDVYMYSAFLNLPDKNRHGSLFFQPSSEVDIVVTTLDKTRGNFYCCVLFSDKQNLLRTRAQIYFENNVKKASFIGGVVEYFFPRYYIARQFICRLPAPSPHQHYSYISLTSSSCPSDLSDFLPIRQPSRVPGGLALCGKIAHSGGLDPENVIEWFEVQRLLGVDKVLIYDLGNPENLNRVFKYYQSLGILDLQPYELPGLPRNRSLAEKWKRTAQFNHDETMAVLECRQRMAGYDYIISHDVDEFIIPRRDVTLKEFLKEQLGKEPNAAGFYFYTEFFITTWDPTNPEEDLMVKRYRKSTVPRWECYKYVYLPSRVTTSVTHQFFPKDSKFIECKVSPDEAILHHYRQCPKDTWGTCSVTTNIDDTMIRYRDLDERVRQVRNATQTT
ncbi:hypothetical protein BsWGS_16680 [Bradybaena similaris]